MTKVPGIFYLNERFDLHSVPGYEGRGYDRLQNWKMDTLLECGRK